MAFEQFQKYIINSQNKDPKHSFHSVKEAELELIEKEIIIPKELKSFYTNIGYGVMFDNTGSYSINKLYSPTEFLKINLRRDYYEFDPTLEYYNSEEFKNYSIFFEIVEGNYLLINNKAVNGKNSIMQINKVIFDSLEEFLVSFDKNEDFFG
jgi:hypothetical protein